MQDEHDHVEAGQAGLAGDPRAGDVRTVHAQGLPQGRRCLRCEAPPPASGCWGRPRRSPGGRGNRCSTERRLAILKAAQIAEALAVTTYTNIINLSPFFEDTPTTTRVTWKPPGRRRSPTTCSRKALTKKPTPFTAFYYPGNMFTDTQTTLNTLVTLEDAFIAAYLVGMCPFSTPTFGSRQPGSWESYDHRTLARVIGPRRGRGDGGRIAGDYRDPESRPSPWHRRTTTATSGPSSGRTSNQAFERSSRLWTCAAEKAGFDIGGPTRSRHSPRRCPAPSVNSTR